MGSSLNYVHSQTEIELDSFSENPPFIGPRDIITPSYCSVQPLGHVDSPGIIIDCSWLVWHREHDIVSPSSIVDPLPSLEGPKVAVSYKLPRLFRPKLDISSISSGIHRTSYAPRTSSTFTATVPEIQIKYKKIN